VVVDGGPKELAARVRALVDELEQRWSRFVDGSEVSALNSRAGNVTLVSDSTYLLVRSAVAARDATGGRFNPLMLDQLEGHGYRHSWQPEAAVPDDRPIEPGSTETIELYPELTAVRLPDGCRFDPGGIGKGLAVDLAIELCQEEGATTASVELGGDLRVIGEPWYGPRWQIGVADPFDRDQEIGSFTPTEGAVTTSTTLIKNWSHQGACYNHLLDPVTGYPTRSDLVAVTTCSSVAWWAEVAAKVGLVSGSDQVLDVLDELNTPGIAVTASGKVLTRETVLTPVVAGEGGSP
jgi:thiamine biosynthesis lipoprotein